MIIKSVFRNLKVGRVISDLSVAEDLNSFSDELQELPKNMRIFSLCLRSLYAENAVGSDANKATSINEIRDKTRRDAMVYVKGVLPLCTQVVRCIQEFFEYYEGLELDEWKECLPDILEEVTGYQQCCTEIVRMHEEMMVPLKQREDEAKKLISELKDLNKTLMEKKAKLEAEAANSKAWAFGLAFVPFVGAIASPLLNMSAESDLANAVAEGQQLNINEAAIMIVGDALIPALSAFLGGLNAVAGFFNIMKEELTTFHSKGEKAVEDTKRLHYIMMKRKAVEIKGSCKEFYAMIPGVRTDLQCIPEKPDDQNYVDKWRSKQQEEIKKKYPKRLTGMLKKMLIIVNQPRGSTACD
ncbi:hypothetical protein BSL78_02941 [Apostichopus japonicus]|uniref:Uncharacterized protein n=1 Tax=Stichopus japonicus TaxID=307972 RepID=A0A2G8LIP7_STIJA|nr:hypothetical protein BSL78_02941 [Apostichopus japonicus]